MFETLSNRLGDVFDKLKGKGTLSEALIEEALREIRRALLEADVALPVVKEFIAGVKEKATGEAVIKSVKPGDQVVKIVNDHLVEILGGDAEELKYQGEPYGVVLVVGLQGSGKTTTTGKLGKFLTEKKKQKVLMASLDVHRPAAQEQLRQLGEQTGVATLEIVAGQDPVTIAKRALDVGRKEGFDTILLDTAGRLHIDEELMDEVAAVRKVSSPTETLLVVDAMTGQDAANIGKSFHEKVGLTGIVLTRIDGDARGGAALSMRSVTGQPIKILGTGEKLDEIEEFDPKRLAGRILGMGDVVGLVERAIESIDEADAEKMAKKMAKGKFDLEDLLSQFRTMKKMGGMGAILGMLPGLGKMKKQIQDKMQDDAFKHMEALILSMTPQERHHPEIIKASRKQRIASGSGRTVQEVNKLLKQYAEMNKMMKRLKKGGGMEKMAQQFMQGGGDMGGLMGGPGGSMPGMGDMPQLPGLGGGSPFNKKN